MSARKLIVTAVAWLCVAGVSAAGAVSASAAVRHKYLWQIAEVPQLRELPKLSEPPPGYLTQVEGIAVDSGDLYTTERLEVIVAGNYVVRTNVFDAGTGAFVSQFEQAPGLPGQPSGVAVGHATGEPLVYVGDKSGSPLGVDVFSADGAHLTGWNGADTPEGNFGAEGVRGLAVDNSNSLSDWAAGDVYVRGRSVVDVFKPEAGGAEKYVTQLTGVSPGEPFKSPEQVAIDESNGDVLVADERGTGTVIDVFAPGALEGSYEFVRAIGGPPPSGTFGPVGGLAVDGASGDVYVSRVQVFEGREESLVDEFSMAGVYLGQIVGSETPGHRFLSALSLAVDPVSHRLYVLDSGAAQSPQEPSVVDVFGPDIVIPDVTTGSVSGVGALGATVNGTVNPDGEGPASCQVVWGATLEFGHSSACSATIPEGDSPVVTQAPLSGLEPDTTYFYRMEATNKNGTNQGETWQTREFKTIGPGMHGEEVTSVAAEAASFAATIDPDGAPTSYYFQYGQTSAYEADTPALSGQAPDGAAIGSGVGDVNVSRHVQGLQVNTTYHYRVVVVSETAPGRVETFTGPDLTFTTQHTGGALTLPDGRGWEQVSPANKHGSLILAIGQVSAVTQAAADGNGITYLATLPTEVEPPGYPGVGQVFSTRGPGGWSSRDIPEPHKSANGLSAAPEYQFFSRDLSLGLLEPQGLGLVPLSPNASEKTPYLRRSALCETPATVGECYSPILSGKQGVADVPPGTKFGEAVHFIGATPDLKHIMFLSRVALTSTAIPRNEIYEWSAEKPADEQVQLVSILPADEGGGPAQVNDGGIGLGLAPRGEWEEGQRAVSADGSRVFWVVGTTLGGERRLYMRDLAKGETVRLDVRQPGASGHPTAEPSFQIASSDGSKVFFTDGQPLTAQSNERGDDLYECEIVEEAGKLKCGLRDLTPATGGHAAEVENMVLGASEDGSYVYFVTGNGLALYEYHDGVSTFIASLSQEDELDWGGSNPVFSNLGKFTSEVSPSGRYLEFMSSRDLVGYDNLDANSGRPDQEVYEYDAVANHLVCASCNPTGSRPVGVEVGSALTPRLVDMSHGDVFSVHSWVAANVATGVFLGGYGESLYQPRYLSDSGRLFFNSSDALVPQDINGNEDVYQYEPAGIGSCTVSSATFGERSGGCVDLISSGTGAGESGFLDASENGEDVFFLTADRLVPQDVDTALDVYDARVCTTREPCVGAPVSVPACTTSDACRAAPLSQPAAYGAPASATFSGTGNIAAAEPAAGKPPASHRVVRKKHKHPKKGRSRHAKRAGRRPVLRVNARKGSGR
ncbi:MAG TPA: NHL repeat-containing protein [Solirubrobacteraceae bacterium]|jgi:hypothetical protein|nr:NHL repeat-containing protein [Solirubrobacteraceae bacterium]